MNRTRPGVNCWESSKRSTPSVSHTRPNSGNLESTQEVQSSGHSASLALELAPRSTPSPAPLRNASRRRTARVTLTLTNPGKQGVFERV